MQTGLFFKEIKYQYLDHCQGICWFILFVCLFLVPMHEYMEAFKYFRYFASFLLAIFSMRLCHFHGHHFKCLHNLSLKWLIIIYFHAVSCWGCLQFVTVDTQSCNESLSVSNLLWVMGFTFLSCWPMWISSFSHATPFLSPDLHVLTREAKAEFPWMFSMGVL